MHRMVQAPAFLCVSLLLLGAGTATAQPNYVGPTPRESDKKPKSYPDVDQLISAGRIDLEAAQAAIGRQDKNAAKKRLADAEKTFEKAVKTNPTSRKAGEALGMVYFYQGITGGKGEFERAARFLGQMVDVDPESITAVRFLAHTHARLNHPKETVTYAGQAAMLSTDTAITREMSELKRPYQEYFLTSWYEYAKWYESPGARLTKLNPQTYALDLVMQITPQVETDLGARGLQTVTQNVQLSPDADLKQYLQNLVDRLIAKTPGPPFTYRVDVVESPQVNAMAFPGHILVNTGLLKFTESEAELVTVLSHEIAHIYAHHSARQLVASYQKAQYAGLLLGAVKSDNKLQETLLNLGVAGALELLARGYSRQQEKEADRYGTHIAFNAGYNPTFMTKFFLRLFEAKPKQPFRLLSTHPPTPDRIQYTTSYLEAFPLETEMQIDSQEFKNMKKRLK